MIHNSTSVGIEAIEVIVEINFSKIIIYEGD